MAMFVLFFVLFSDYKLECYVYNISMSDWVMSVHLLILIDAVILTKLLTVILLECSAKSWLLATHV